MAVLLKNSYRNYVEQLITGIPGGAQQSFKNERRACRLYADMKAHGMVDVVRSSEQDHIIYGPEEYAKM